MYHKSYSARREIAQAKRKQRIAEGHLRVATNQEDMKSYSWAEMDKWSKTKLIERIRALEHELAKPVKNRSK